jgi:tRNA uridine 5-carboxymethylaminomethyl modification enzyme
MFTSRAEFRLTLRSDNADARLTPLANDLGLATPQRLQKLTEKTNAMQRAIEALRKTRLPVGPSGTLAYDFLRRPDINWQELKKVAGEKLQHLFADPAITAVMPEVETDAKYAGYVAREKETAKRMHELEDKTIPANFAFESIAELRKEARQSLARFRPQTLGQASRLEGITPNDLTVLLLHLRRGGIPR